MPVLEMQGVSRVYPGPPPVTALQNCNLTVSRGEMASIVGPSGSGKSTLLNLLGLLDRPTAGEYRLNGINTSTLPEADRSAARGALIGFVFQAFHLLPHRSATENVAVGLLYSGVAAPERFARARESLVRVGLGHRLEAPPSQLSGGERQRVAIARALVHEPALLLCDEPTGNLDSVSADSVLDLISGLHRDGRTVLIITHDPQVAKRAQRKLAIRDGLLTEEVAE